MTRLRNFMLFACAAGAIGLSATPAATDFWEFDGGFRQPRPATSNVQYTNYGFVNNGTTATITAECPFSATVTSACVPTLEVVGALVYDRNGSKNVTCTVKYMKQNGDIIQNISQSSSGNSLSSQLFIFNVNQPAGGPRLHMTCSVPPKTSSGLSAITYYQLTFSCQ